MPGPLFHPEQPDNVLVTSPDVDAVPDAVLPEVVAGETGDDAPMGAEIIEAEDTGASDDVPDEQTRLIGPLRIGIRLYNVYLNEADEWSRRLGNCLTEWSLERHEPLPDQAEALAHSLAGSSATVGFQPLSDIARALEHALGLVGSHQRAGQAPTAEQASLFVDAAEDIRRLLHQFAAGFYKEPNADLLSRLHDQLHLPLVEAVTVDDGEGDVAVADDAGLDIELNTQWDTQPESEPAAQMDALIDTQPSAFASLDAGSVPPDEPETELSPLLPESESRGPVQDIDDDIDALDTIDVDLFPIFADEAQELLPQLGGALRQWIARPDNGSARGEVLRNLHTLKGSARLAGALRLGEMAHRMETSVERLGSEGLQGIDLDPLQMSYDALCARFDLLRQTDPSVHGVLQTAPEQMLGTGLATITVVDDHAGAPASEPVSEAPATEAAVQAATGLSGLSLPQVPVPAQQRMAAAVRVRP